MSSIKPRIQNLTAVAAVLQVARHGSFVAGSKALGMSPSAASKSITRLEEELGTRLFQRTTRSVSLTPEGQLFVAGTGPLLDDLDALTAELADAGVSPRGPLRLSAPESFGRAVVVPIVEQYRERYPEVTVELLLDDRTLDLADARIDVAIRTGVLSDHANLVARRLLVDPMILCAAPSYLETRGRPNSVDDLNEHACVRFLNAQTGAPLPWRFSDNGRPDVPSTLLVNDVSAVAALTEAGSGIAQLPGYLAAPLLAEQRLVELLPNERPDGVPYSALYLDRRFVSPRIRTWIDLLADATAQ